MSIVDTLKHFKINDRLVCYILCDLNWFTSWYESYTFCKLHYSQELWYSSSTIENSNLVAKSIKRRLIWNVSRYLILDDESMSHRLIILIKWWNQVECTDVIFYALYSIIKRMIEDYKNIKLIQVLTKWYWNRHYKVF